VLALCRPLEHLRAVLALCRPFLGAALIHLLLLRFLALCRPHRRAALTPLLMFLALSRPWLLWQKSLGMLLLMVDLSERCSSEQLK
jgi:hypothetical protein